MNDAAMGIRTTNSVSWFVLISCLGLLWCGGALALTPETVRLQLKWQHQFQFAGYYAALEKGYYRNAGLDVVILPSETGDDPTQEVLLGKADFGVGSTGLLLRRAKGDPVVVLAAIFQHSPLALMALETRGIQSLHDLVGRRLMIETDSAELLAYLRREGISENSFTRLAHDFSTRDLAQHKIDAMSVYTTDEPFELKESGQPFILYSPRSGGIDFYGDNLFTTEQQLDQHPERVRAFRSASLEGWKYAMEHTDEIAQLIYERYSTRHSLSHLRYEAAQMKSLLNTDVVEPGHMYAGRWQHIADVYAELGMLEPDFKLAGFMYNPTPGSAEPTWLLASLAGLIALMLVVGSIALYILKINRRLNISERRWTHLFDTTPLAVMVLDPANRLLAWNNAATRIFGWSQAEALGRDVVRLTVPPDEQAKVSRLLSDPSQNIRSRSVNTNCTKSGAVITCEWHNTAFRDRDGRAIWSISVALDVSDRVLSEQRLTLAKEMAEQLLADQRNFFSMISHELRSPLGVIDAAAQVLQVRCEEECGSSEVIRRVRRGVRRLSGFVDNCLAEDRLVRIGAQGIERRDEVIDLALMLQSAVNQTMVVAPRHHIVLECADDIGTLLADPELVAIMLTNLLGNACKYSSDTSTVWLRAMRRVDRALELVVQDQGHGIATQDINDVCRRYFRGSNSSQSSGVGLGLFLVKRIVDLHGGTLEISSRLGIGTRVQVSLPATVMP